MRVVLTTFGTSGDVGPIFAIATALRRQGGTPVVVTNPFWEEKLRRMELDYRLCGESWDPIAVVEDPRLTHPHFGPFNVWKDVYAPLVPQMFEATRACIQEAPTAMVLNHIWCFGGWLAAEAEAVPKGMVGLAPLTWYSSEDPSLYSEVTPPAWMHSWAIRGPLRSMMRSFFSRSLRKICKGLELPDHKDLFFSSQSEADLNIGLWSPHMRPPAADDPPNAHICGFPSSPKDHDPPPLDDALEAFLDAGDPPVVLGLGSALPRSAPDVYQAAAAACRAHSVRGVLVGADPEMIPDAGDDLFLTPFAPYVSLFPRASVVMHHAGIGTLAESLCAARPAVAIPFGNDQFDNAWRAEKLGVSVTLHRKKVTAKRLTAALEKALSDESIKARAAEIGPQVTAEASGAEEAAKVVLGLR